MFARRIDSEPRAELFTTDEVGAGLLSAVLPIYARVLGKRTRGWQFFRWKPREMGVPNSFERFQNDAQKYAAYLETPEGRLRIDLAFANLQEYLPPSPGSLRALDLGCGTGAVGVRLAKLGLHVTLMDPSPAMLHLAESAARRAGVIESIELKEGQAERMPSLFPDGCFDLMVCHNVLEFVDDPVAVLRGAARALRRSSGRISVLVRNQPGEVLKAALLHGDLAAAEQSLAAEWGNESLYDGKVRLFTPESLREMLMEAGFSMKAERGVRILCDYLPPRVSRKDEYDRIFELERKLGMLPQFAAVARYVHCLAIVGEPELKDGV